MIDDAPYMLRELAAMEYNSKRRCNLSHDIADDQNTNTLHQWRHANDLPVALSHTYNSGVFLSVDAVAVYGVPSFRESFILRDTISTCTTGHRSSSYIDQTPTAFGKVM